MVACLFSTLALATVVSAQSGPPAGGPIRTAPAAAPASSGTSVVVIDIAYIFKNHTRFNAAMQDIKTDIEQFEAYVRKKQTDFRTQGEALQQFKAGTPEYRQKEEELARLQSDLQVEVALKKKEFLEQEARVYFRVYKEIEQEVSVFAQRYRISLVLRYNRDDMKEDDRASVLQGVNRAVVFQQNLDITEPILKQLNGSAPPPTTPAGGASGTISTRPGPVVPRPNTPR
jgi:Skp family chaperone for outer membrane proteins